MKNTETVKANKQRNRPTKKQNKKNRENRQTVD